MKKIKRSDQEHKAETINTSSKMEDHWMIWVFSILELIFLTIMIAFLISPVNLLLTGNRTEATVVGLASAASSVKDTDANLLYTPIVEYYTLSGEKITAQGSNYMATSPFKVGDKTTVVYSPNNLKGAQIISWTELPLIPAGTFFAFFIFTLLIWISWILIDGTGNFNDPLGLLPRLIAHFQLNPVRFPILFILSLALPVCVISSYVLTKQGIDLHAHGIRVVGHVLEDDDNFAGFESLNKSNGKSDSGRVYVTFEDSKGETITILRSLRRPLCRLQAGEAVQVVYPANRPHAAVVDTWDEIFFAPTVWGFFVVMFLIVLWGVFKMKIT